MQHAFLQALRIVIGKKKLGRKIARIFNEKNSSNKEERFALERWDDYIGTDTDPILILNSIELSVTHEENSIARTLHTFASCEMERITVQLGRLVSHTIPSGSREPLREYGKSDGSPKLWMHRMQKMKSNTVEPSLSKLFISECSIIELCNIRTYHVSWNILHPIEIFVQNG